MENKVLSDIRDFALAHLQSAYGYCGVADSKEFVMLNSSDGEGKNIKITIKTEEGQTADHIINTVKISCTNCGEPVHPIRPCPNCGG